MISPVNSTNLSNQKYNNINFNGLNKISPLNIYMEKVFDRFTHISKNRWFPIDDAIKPNLKVVKLRKGKISAQAWDINPYNSKKYIIFYHGLGQNITSNQEMYKKIIDKGYAVLSSEYGSFGESTGKMNAKSIQNNTSAAVEYLNKKGINNSNIGIVGYSMGSFPAIELASKNNDMKFLVLISPFNSLKNESELLIKGKTVRLPKFVKYSIDKFPFLLNFLDNVFKTNTKKKKIHLPVYLIHSENDKIVSTKSTKQLAEFTNNLKAFVILKTGGHSIETNKINAFEKLSEI